MSIGDFLSGFTSIFSFKSAFQAIITSDTISDILEYAKEQIIAKVNESIPGAQKMNEVIDAVVEYAQEHVTSDNKLVQWLIDHFMENCIRTVLQLIYDSLKEFVENLTEKLTSSDAESEDEQAKETDEIEG